MRTVNLMLKDLRQVLRDRRALIFLLVMPMVFTAFMGLALRPAAPGDPRLPVGMVLEDNGVSGQGLSRLLDASLAIRRVSVATAGEAEARVQTGELASALILPADFTPEMQAGGQPAITVIADTVKPEGQAAQQALQGVVTRLLSAAQAGQLSVQLVQPATPDRGGVWTAGVEQAITQWLASTVSLNIEKATGDPAASRPNAFAQSSPGMLVMFSMFGLMNTAMVLVLERKSHALQRLLTTSMRRSEIIAGHLLAMFTLVVIQGIILIGFGQVVFGVDYLRQPLGSLVLLAAFGLWVASLGLFISVVARGTEQVTLLAMAAMFIFSALGGAWFPLEGTGGAFAAVGQLMPTAWAMTGFQNIVVRGLDFSSVLMPAGILLAYAAAFFALAVWRFKFE